jgi:hypothetical protein
VVFKILEFFKVNLQIKKTLLSTLYLKRMQVTAILSALMTSMNYHHCPLMVPAVQCRVPHQLNKVFKQTIHHHKHVILSPFIIQHQIILINSCQILTLIVMLM